MPKQQYSMFAVKKPLKVAVGAASLMPLAFACFLTLLSPRFNYFGGQGASAFQFLVQFVPAIAWGYFFLLAGFLLHLAGAPKDWASKVAWMFGLIGAGVIVMPIYWYTAIWSARAS